MHQNAPKLSSSILLLFLSMFFMTTIVGCGAPKKYSINSDQFNINNSGIVLGKVTNQRFYGLFMYDADGGGRGLVFKNKDTGEKIPYTGAHYFEMRLPEGKYQLVYMGTPAGGIIPRMDPFEFNIQNGEIKYIGSIVADRDLKRHLEKINVRTPVLGQHVFAIKDYGEIIREGLAGTPTDRARKPFFTFYIIDERDEVINKFKEKCPETNIDSIIVDYMN